MEDTEALARETQAARRPLRGSGRHRRAAAHGPLRALVLALCVGALGLGSLTACVRIQLALRDPGEVNRAMPADVAEEYDCANRPLPFFRIERNELLPERVRAGHELAHRIVYVLCPRRPTEVVSGQLDTRILFKGRAIFEETIDQDLKPGRWIIDTLIPLPEEAEPGVYALQVRFTSSHGKLEERSDFLVQAD